MYIEALFLIIRSFFMILDIVCSLIKMNNSQKYTAHTKQNGVLFEDILLERRNSSDLRWAAQEWEAAVLYKFKKKVNRKISILKVLNSDRVQHIINQSISKGENRNTIEKNVISILEQMSHNLNVTTIRRFALILPKIMKKIYGQVFVNPDGIERLKSIVEDTPVILLPSHRSYADFLLVSYMFYHYFLPFPVIAAGMDFMTMAIIGDMLRGAGAFYIKRSFINDELYWAVFQEYVQTLLCDYGHPLEFFLEGTRSRSGKSLPPKKGLLCCAIECWLRSKVPDLMVVPISISYNRTLEEKLFAYELLGVPKPKESTSGLLKAMKILKEDFGDIYFNIGDPISVSKWMSPRVERHIMSVCPSHLSSLSRQELDTCEDFSLTVLRHLQKNSVISVWSLISITLMQTLWRGECTLPREKLLSQTALLAQMATFLDAKLERSDTADELNEQMNRSLSMHNDIVSEDSHGNITIHEIHNATLKESDYRKGLQFSDSTVAFAIQQIFLQHYVNQSLHIFIRPVIVSFILHSSSGSSMDFENILKKYSLLSLIFSNDFIFERGMEKEDVLCSLKFLCEFKECHQTDATTYTVQKTERFSSLLMDLLKPFLLCYQATIAVCRGQDVWRSEGDLVNRTQYFLEESAKMHLLYSALSLDTCKQAVKMLFRMDAIKKEKEYDHCILVVNFPKLDSLKMTLGDCLLASSYVNPKL